MNEYELFISLAVSLGVGLLIGLQREQQAMEEHGDKKLFLGGIRTFPLYALVGSLSMLLGRQVGSWAVGVGFVALMAPLVVSYADDVAKGRDRGLTTKTAFAVTFLLGVLAQTEGLIEPLKNRLLLVAAIGVVVTTLLSLKRPLHELVTKVSHEDIYATVKFLVVAVVALPLLPDEAYGPLKALNPFHIGLMITLIAGISFVGYVAFRVWGAGKGLGMTGLLGGLVSSTAVTLSFSERSRREPQVVEACALGVVLASTVMFVRIVAMVAVVYPELVPAILPSMSGSTLGGVLAAGLLYRKSRQAEVRPEEVKLTNPFELNAAIKFGLLFGVVLLVSKAARSYLGSGGIYLASALAGTTSTDAVTLSVADMAKEGLPHTTAAVAILLAAAAAMLIKGLLAAFLGSPGFRGRVVFSFLVMIGAGTAGLAWLGIWR
ncbi:MAG: MgtC/SapB family protein [Planctomycetes bacterium]|nr:MgtC/SapB family protein [Planctomycetota bacterium]